GSDRYIASGHVRPATRKVIGGDQPAIVVLDVPRADAVFAPAGVGYIPAASARPGIRRHPVTRATARTGMPPQARRFQPPTPHQDQLELSGIGSE
ncbi:hypothetical protein, partial [Actinoplanes palleronii]|uniref:hypothetical protein n=1 Tax=Actinoplanes palleronii TaxID=113570 RepID=UPI001943C6FE